MIQAVSRQKIGERRARMQRVGAILPKGAKKAFRQHGFAEGAMIRHWKDIAGHQLASCSLPLRLSRTRARKEGGATLYLLVESAAAVEVQHQIPLLIEKLNIFYGYPAVARVALVQGRIERPAQEKTRQAPKADPKARKKAKKWAAGVKEEGLKSALVGIGEQVLRDKEK